jgi:hypothetical protein
MTTRCAWCADPEPARPGETRAISHGICPACLDRRLAAPPPERPARRLGPPTPLRWLSSPQPAPLGA